MSTRFARLGFALGFAWVIASLMTVAMLITSCGKNPAGPTGASTTFQGTIAGSMSLPSGPVSMSGTMTVTIQTQVARAATPGFRLTFVAALYAQGTSVSASGSFHVTGDPLTTSLTGTFDSSTKTLSLSGGGFTFTGSVDNGQVTGTFTGPNSAIGSFSGLNSSSSTVTRYCGTFTGSQSGIWNFEVSGNQALGLVAEFGRPALSMSGQVNGATITFLVAQGGAGTGTIQGASVSGTWTGTPGSSGTFSGSTSAC